MKKTLLIICGLILIFVDLSFGQKMVYVRKNANSPKAKADLEAYAKAMAIMKTKKCGDPLSWYYQGAIHSLPNSFTGGVDSLCLEYNGSNDKAGWNTCPHMKPVNLQLNFLTWHRLYILHLEKIVRKLSGKKDFALPYWDYTNVQNRTMPVQFRSPDNYSNPLFEVRAPSLTKGLPINSKAIDPGMVITACDSINVVAFESMGWALDTTHLWQSKKINYFSTELEDGVHNIMHDYMGGDVGPDTSTALYNRIYQNYVQRGPIGDVPSSAFDPIFFLHHCQIDRLWMSWENSFPALRLTEEEFTKQGMIPYIFFDENGNKVVYNNLEEVYAANRDIDYTYDYMVRQKTNNATILAATKPAKFSGEVVVGRIDTTVVLTKKEATFAVLLKKIVDKKTSLNALYTLEIDLTVAKPTNTKLVVTLNDCKSTNLPKEANQFIVGVVGMFGLGHDHENMSAKEHKDMKMDMPFTKKLRFDITAEIAQQLRRGFQFNQPIVGIIPQSFDASSPITVKSVIIKEVMKR